MNRRLAVAAIASALALPACHDQAVEQVETTAAVPVAVETAHVQTFVSKITTSGLVTPAPGAELTVVAPEAARIAEVPHGEGEPVKAGDLLVRFEIPSLAADVATRRAGVSQASARVEAARANFNRLSGLLAQGVAAPREVEDARRQLSEAEADLEQSRSAVDAAASLAARTAVHAPFSGVIAKRFHNPGDFVDASAADPVLKVINPARLQILAAVPVADLSRVVIGHLATIRESGNDDGHPARVVTKAAQVDPDSATGDVRLAFAMPTALAAGTRVEVEIVGEEHKSALVIPAAAIVTEEGDVFVMVAGPDDKAHKYPVAIGLSTRTQVEITSGLKDGDRVIIRGQAGLPEGAAVKVEGK